MNRTFLKECLKQLRDMNFCYVYTISQVDEVMRCCKQKTTYEPNDCGYTIKVIRKEANNE